MLECIVCGGHGKAGYIPFHEWWCTKCGCHMSVCEKCRKKMLIWHRVYCTGVTPGGKRREYQVSGDSEFYWDVADGSRIIRWVFIEPGGGGI